MKFENKKSSKQRKEKDYYTMALHHTDVSYRIFFISSILISFIAFFFNGITTIVLIFARERRDMGEYLNRYDSGENGGLFMNAKKAVSKLFDNVFRPSHVTVKERGGKETIFIGEDARRRSHEPPPRPPYHIS